MSSTDETRPPSKQVDDEENDDPHSSIAFTMKIDPDDSLKIERVRARFYKYTTEKPDKFHEKDLERVKNEDWWTLRFIKWNRGNEDKALKQMINAFKWRKSFGINDRTVQDLPIEFGRAAAIFPYGCDYKGRTVLYLRVKVYRKISQLNIYFQQFVAGIIDHVDRESGPNGYVFLFDVTGMGLVNVDFDFLQFLLHLIQNYYPYGQRYAICYNVPRIVRPLWSVAKMFLGSAEKAFRFCDAEELKKYIPPESLLRYMGGESDFDFTNFEELRDCPSVVDLASKYGFTQDDVDKYYKLFEPHLQEAALLAKGQTAC